MEIIHGRPSHHQSVLAIITALPEYFSGGAIGTIRGDLRSHQLYVAVESGTVTGFAIVDRRDGDTAEILWMGVTPERHGGGIGTALLEHLAAELRAAGAQLLLVRTLDDAAGHPPYQRTSRFYRRAGFLHCLTIDPFPGWDPGNPCAVMVKILR